MHLVRVTAQQITCWPNLGYGRFGSPVIHTLSKPIATPFVAGRVSFADTDSTDAADLVYLHHDRVSVFSNISGNGLFRLPDIPLPGTLAPDTQPIFADAFATGKKAMVIACIENGELAHWACDFNNTTALALLESVENGSGLMLRFGYQSSSNFYLADRALDRNWLSYSPNPVAVVTKSETIDQIGNTSSVSEFSYHNAHYDRAEREFRGFSYVETTHGATSKLSDGKAKAGRDGLIPTKQSLTRQWYHTGASPHGRGFSDHYRKSKDGKKAADADPYFQYNEPTEPNFHLGDSQPALYPAAGADVNTCKVEAYRALYGKLIRQEVYDATDWQATTSKKPAVPFAVLEENFALHCHQPADGLYAAAVSVSMRENVSYHIERKSDDPRIEHTLITETNTFGHPTRAAHIYYPRQSKTKPSDPSQYETRILGSYSAFLKIADDVDLWLGGLESEDRLYEIKPPVENLGALFDFKIIAGLLNKMGAKNPSTTKSCRLLTWDRHYYLALSGNSDAVNSDDLAPQGLPTESWSAVFPEKIKPAHIGARFTPKRLHDEAGYHLKNGYWWQSNGRLNYQRSQKAFYEVTEKVDALKAKAKISYDPTWLYPETFTDAAQNTLTSIYDHYTQTPIRITDSNGVVTEKMFDACGQQVMTSVYGYEGKLPAGDAPLKKEMRPTQEPLKDIIKNAKKHLGTASSVHFYDHHALPKPKGGHAPTWSIEISRIEHVSDGLDIDGLAPRVAITVQYFDGLHRLLQTKTLCDPGPALARDKDGKLIQIGRKKYKTAVTKYNTVDTETRWHASGFVIYDNKNKEVRQFEPFFSTTWEYEDEPALRSFGLSGTTTFDAIGRPIRSDDAAGYYSSVEFDAWSEVHSDRIDTMADSNGLKAVSRALKTRELELSALKAAWPYKNTPATEVLNAQGHVVASKIMNHQKPYITTRYAIDIEGHTTSIADTNHDTVVMHEFDMVGRPIFTKSAVTGKSWTLFNAIGASLRHWDDQNRCLMFEYDGANRPVAETLIETGKDGSDLNREVIRTSHYPPKAAGKDANNLRGHMIRQTDESGTFEFSAYSIKGQALDYTCTIKLPDGLKSPVALKPFRTTKEYDALGRIIRQNNPDGSAIVMHFGLAGHLTDQQVKDPTGKMRQILSKPKFTARGARKEFTLGSHITRSIQHDQATGNVTKVTTSAGDGKNLLDLRYAFDPENNIHAIIDAAPENGGPNEITKYHYDGINQLTNSETKAAGKSLRSEWFGYDQLGNLTMISSDEAVGDKIAKFVRNLTYERGSNRLTSVKGTGLTGTLEPDYDPRGNLKMLDSETSLSWDAFDRLNKITWGGAASGYTELRYDAMDRKTYEATFSTTDSAADATLESERIHLAGIQILRDYEQGPDGAIQMSETHILDIEDHTLKNAVLTTPFVDGAAGKSELNFLISDHLGSVRHVLSEETIAIAAQNYGSYGTSQTAEALPDDLSRLGYSGQPMHGQSGLYDYGARYYSPDLGRWLNPDPAGMVDGPNLYAFAGGNPVSFIDSGGHAKGDGRLKLPPVSQSAWNRPEVTGID